MKNKIASYKLKRALVALLLFSPMFMALIGVVNIAPVASAAPVTTGDTYAGETHTWYINQSTTYRNTTLYLNCSNIRINNYGDASLMLDNTTIYFEKNMTIYNGENIFSNDTAPIGLTIKHSRMSANETWLRWAQHHVSYGNTTFLNSHLYNMFYVRVSRVTAGGGITSADVKVIGNTLTFSLGTPGTAIYSFDARTTKRMWIQRNNFYVNRTPAADFVNLYRPVEATSANLEYHIGNNTYYRNDGYRFRVFNIGYGLDLYNEVAHQANIITYQSTLPGRTNIYEPIAVYAVDHAGNNLNTDVSIHWMDAGTYKNTTTGTTVFLYAGCADGTGASEDAAHAPWNVAEDLRYNITFPDYAAYGISKIVNTTIAMHYLGVGERYFRTLDSKYQRLEYNITCHVSPFWRNYPEYYLPYLPREDDWGNHSASGALTAGTWENDSAIFDLMYEVYTSRGFKFTWCVNEVSSSTWAASRWNSRLDDRYIGWLNNHSTARDGTAWVEFSTHFPNHDDHSWPIHADYPSIWQNVSYSTNFSINNMSYTYKGIIFPNDDAPVPNMTNALLDHDYWWTGTPDGEVTDGGNSTAPLMRIASNWLYLTHYLWNADPALGLNFNPYPLAQHTGVAFASFAGNQVIKTPGGTTYTAYQVGRHPILDTPYYSYTNHQYLMRNQKHIDGDQLYNWTKWDALNETLDRADELYDLRPMTYSEFYMYRRSLENITYEQRSDRWVVDGSNNPYDLTFYAHKIYGDDTLIYNARTGQRVAWTEGSVVWTAEAGESYYITGSSLESEFLRTIVVDTITTWVPFLLIVMLFVTALGSLGIKLERKRW